MNDITPKDIQALEYVLRLAAELVSDDRKSIERRITDPQELEAELSVYILRDEAHLDIAFAALNKLKAAQNDEA